MSLTYCRKLSRFMCSGLPPHQTCHPHSTWSHHMPRNKIYLSPGNPGDADRTTENVGSMGSPVAQPCVSCWPTRAGSLTSQFCSCLNMMATHRHNEPQYNVRASSHVWEDGAYVSSRPPFFSLVDYQKEIQRQTRVHFISVTVLLWPHSNLEQVEKNSMLSLSSKENGTFSSRNTSVVSHETPALLVNKAFSTLLVFAGITQFIDALFYHTNIGTEAFQHKKCSSVQHSWQGRMH